MFCTKCGAEIPDDSNCCPACGENLQQDVATNPAEPTAVLAAEPTAVLEGNEPVVPTMEMNPVKSKKKPIIIAAIVAVCILLFGTIGVNAFNGNISNLFAKMTKSDAEYMQWVNKREKDTLISLYNNSADKARGKISGSAEISLTEDGKMFLDDMGVDEDDIAWFDSLSVEMTENNSKKDNALEWTAKVNLNKTELGEASVVLDGQDGEMYISFPDYLKETLRVKVDNGTTMMEALNVYDSLLESDASDILSDYLDVVFESLNNVEKEKTTLSASGVSQKCTKYEATIDYDTVVACAKNILEKAKTDDKLKEWLCDELESLEKYPGLSDEIGIDVDDFMDEYYEGIDEALDALDELDEDDFNYHITYSIYVNNNGRIIGREFAYDNGDSYYEESGEIKLYTTKNNSKFGVELKADVNDMTLFSIVGDGKVSGQKYTGDLKVKVDGEECCTIGLEKVNLLKSATGKLNGKLIIKPGDLICDEMDSLEDMAISVAMSGKTDGAKLNIAIEQDEKELMTLKVTCETGKSSSVSIPKNAIDIDDEDFDEDSIDWDTLIERLEKAGVPEEYTEELSDLF